MYPISASGRNLTQTGLYVKYAWNWRWVQRLFIALGACGVGLWGVIAVMLVANAAGAAAPPPIYSVNSGDFFFPPYPSEHNRFGISVGGDITIERFDVALLKAGWYVDWTSRANPSFPNQMEYAQMLYLNVKTGPCSINKRPASLITEVVHITGSKLINNLAANPGALWIVGNEPDSIYNCSPIMPDTYAQVYHNVYTFIKKHDPSARVAIGGIIQPTPLRLEYLDKVWDAYLRFYGTTLPTDLWNIHLYALREEAGGWGGGVPPDASGNGIDYPMRASVDMSIMRGHIERMRQWMAGKGESHKPLIVSEYGVLWPFDYCDGGVCFDEATVANYMRQTFDYFMTAVSSSVGCPTDGYRMVQMWNWYSTNDNNIYNGDLFYLSSGQLSIIGQAYANYAAPLVTPYRDQSLWNLTAKPAAGDAPVKVMLKAGIAEMGNTPSNSATVKFYEVYPSAGQTPFSTQLVQQPLTRHYSMATVEAMWTATDPGLYTWRATLTPGVSDANLNNNTRTVTLDLRPDLSTSLAVGVEPAVTTVATATAQAEVINRGAWPSHNTLMRLSMSNTLTHYEHYDVTRTFDLLPAASGALTFTSLITQPGRYAVSLRAECEGACVESDYTNNSNLYTYNVAPELAAELHTDVSTDTVIARARVSVANLGTWPAHATPIQMIVTDTRISQVVYSATQTVTVLAQRSAVLTFTWHLSRPSTYVVTVMADPNRLLDEINRQNNLVQQNLDVRPDLALSNLSFTPSWPTLGDEPSAPVTISAMLSNIGLYSSQKMATVTVQVSSVSGPMMYTNQYTSPALLPGQTWPFFFVWNVTAAGSYIVTASVNTDATIAEANTANNVVSRPLVVARRQLYLPLGLLAYGQSYRNTTGSPFEVGKPHGPVGAVAPGLPGVLLPGQVH